MRAVLDANILIAALLGSRRTLKLVASASYQWYAPQRIVEEITKHKPLLCERSRQSFGEFEETMAALLLFVRLLDPAEYEAFMEVATKGIGERDRNDADYVAAALAVHAYFLWTNDKDFTAQGLVPTKTTHQLLQEAGEPLF